MQAANSSFLGQIVPTSNYQGLTSQISQNIANKCSARNTKKIQILVGSANQLKVDATREAVTTWAQTYFKNPDITVTGCEVSSEINEQPHGHAETHKGAKNRLINLRKCAISKTEEDALVILVAMENGLIEENVTNLRNPDIFANGNGKAWVDRCLVVAEIRLRGLRWSAEADSVGVTTPNDCVQLSENSNWDKTAGSFIAEKYKVNAKDWHGKLAGKGREQIMKQAVLSAFGLQE